ncbi:hypothetical protein HKD37_20G055882 [Glycine soja]
MRLWWFLKVPLQNTIMSFAQRTWVGVVQLLGPNDVAPCRSCRPRIFFINGVFCFLKINDSRMKKEER